MVRFWTLHVEMQYLGLLKSYSDEFICRQLGMYEDVHESQLPYWEASIVSPPSTHTVDANYNEGDGACEFNFTALVYVQELYGEEEQCITPLKMLFRIGIGRTSLGSKHFQPSKICVFV